MSKHVDKDGHADELTGKLDELWNQDRTAIVLYLYIFALKACRMSYDNDDIVNSWAYKYEEDHNYVQPSRSFIRLMRWVIDHKAPKQPHRAVQHEHAEEELHC